MIFLAIILSITILYLFGGDSFSTAAIIFIFVYSLVIFSLFSNIVITCLYSVKIPNEEFVTTALIGIRPWFVYVRFIFVLIFWFCILYIGFEWPYLFEKSVKNVELVKSFNIVSKLFLSAVCLAFSWYSSKEMFYFNTKFVNTTLDESIFEKAYLKGLTFEDCKLKNVNFQKAELEDAVFVNCNLFCADFRGANLDNAKFVNSNTLNAKGLETYMQEKTKQVNISSD